MIISATSGGEKFAKPLFKWVIASGHKDPEARPQTEEEDLQILNAA